MHQANIAHRDIKPDNVMVTRDFTIKLIDLDYGMELEGKKQEGYMHSKLGTAFYMAPEIL